MANIKSNVQEVGIEMIPYYVAFVIDALVTLGGLTVASKFCERRRVSFFYSLLINLLLLRILLLKR